MLVKKSCFIILDSIYFLETKIKMERSFYCETCVSIWGHIENRKNDNVFKVNGHRLKVYFDNFSVENDSIELSNPVYKD